MFGKKKRTQKLTYDEVNTKPVVRCSICTGEQVAGFQDIHTGKIQEVMMIRGEEDLQRFREMYGLHEVTKIY